MNIYLVERKGDPDWDEYFGFVVIAESEEHAKQITFKEHDPDYEFSGWTREVNVEDIGISHREQPRIVQGSFNSG
ncbi:MAG TPA: hypothetical protein VFT87_05505 [Candidatus Saccharimonadales bacterium]|nr:hypothetical protein [Candidatus Saccharimonadales bacterium]